MVDKLFRMYLELLNHKKLRANYLAEKLEISVRTVYRYVDALSLSGIPVYTEQGKNGGISLCEDSRLYSQTLSDEEINTILSALDNINLPHTLSIIDDIKNKLCSLKGYSENSIFTLDNKRIVIDNTYLANNKRIETIIRALDKAMNNLLSVNINYHDRNGAISERNIEPHSFVVKDGTWYIYAWCNLRNTMRLFKLSRITNIVITDKKYVQRKVNKDWQLDYTHDANPIEITLRVKNEAKYRVEEWLGIDAFSSKKTPDIAVAMVNNAEELYSKLLSFGDKVEVLSPESIVNKLMITTQNMLKSYENSTKQ